MKDSIEITGVWLRRTGDNAEVLAEVGGSWKLLATERLDGQFSHIVETSGMAKAPDDPVSASA